MAEKPIQTQAAKMLTVRGNTEVSFIIWLPLRKVGVNISLALES